MVQKFLQEYKDIPPIGNILRKDYKNYCFRIHNLANNKRYPTNNEDTDAINILYNQITDISCKSNTILGFISFYDFDVNELENPWLKTLNLTFLKEFNINDKDDDVYYVKTYTFSINKNSPILRDILLDIADEEFDGSLLLYCDNLYSSISIAPYPGGVDIFTKNKELQNTIQNKIRSWGITIQKCP